MDPADLPTVTVTSLSEGALLVDVREPHEWEAGHAPEATHLPLGEVRARQAELPRDRPVDVVCHFGGRSAQAVAFLRTQGVDARNVAGGMDAWEKAGLPVVDGAGAPGRVV